MVDSLNTTVTTPIYQVPFSSLLPKTSEITNLAVTVCMSASHIAFCSLRVEPTYMVTGEAAGTAAAMAASSGTDISGITAAELQAKLTHYGVVINIPS